MSLHTLANHMSAHGRGPDTTLVHMSPREVHGLQALAQTQGQSLTINPHTGLPEAGILDNLLPAIAGFALNAFAPGVGTAVGSLFGLGGAAGTGLLVGGITGLATGSLEKGLMAGLGGYGGAGLGSALAGAGAPSAAMDAASGARDAGISAAAEASPAATAARLQAGANTAMSAPMDFLDKNKWNLAAAGAPALMGAFDEEEETAAKPHPGYIRKYERDPITGSLYQVSATPADQYTGGGSFGGVPAPVTYGASGGLMQHYETGGATFGGVGAPVDANGNPITPTTQNTVSDSQRVQDYLLGKPGAFNPFLFYHAKAGTKAAPAATPAALNTAGVSALIPEFVEHGGRGGRGTSLDGGEDDGGSAANGFSYAPDPNSITNGLVHGILSPPNSAFFNAMYHGDPNQNNAPIVDKSVLSAKSQEAAMRGFVSSEGSEGTGAAQGSSPAPAAGAVNSSHGGDSGGWGGRDAGGGRGANAAPAPAPGTGVGFGGIGASPYADGGGITALAEGGMYNLGSYSDGGRLLRGPGDGVSDDIPATIGQNQPARLADGEFVVPARIVSELGNGSTEAGARKLYAMMDRVQKARSKTVGKNKVAANSRADKYLPV